MGPLNRAAAAAAVVVMMIACHGTGKTQVGLNQIRHEAPALMLLWCWKTLMNTADACKSSKMSVMAIQASALLYMMASHGVPSLDARPRPIPKITVLSPQRIAQHSTAPVKGKGCSCC